MYDPNCFHLKVSKKGASGFIFSCITLQKPSGYRVASLPQYVIIAYFKLISEAFILKKNYNVQMVLEKKNQTKTLPHHPVLQGLLKYYD